MKFSELMHMERKTKRITLRRLYQMTGIAFSKLSEIDAGRVCPSINEKKLICSALGIYFQDLSLGKDNVGFRKIEDQTPTIADIIRIGNAREYQKYEFCKAVDCAGIGINEHCVLGHNNCIRTAKEFHHWLNENGFKIVKGENV